MNPFEKIPAAVRAALYLVWLLGFPVLAYTEARGWTGENERQLWYGLGTAAGVTAIANIRSKPDYSTEGYVSGVRKPIDRGGDHYVEDELETGRIPVTLPEDTVRRGTP